MKKNKYGLSRNIPQAVKRIVRQKCGFGCVICGSGIIQYEHVLPEFHNARSHNPKNITLLCPQCHSKVTTGMWSKEKVLEAMKKPKCLSRGYAKEVFDIGNGFPIVRFAGSTFTNCRIPLQIKGIPVFTIDNAKEPGGPFFLSATFYDREGNNSLKIVNNEWFASSGNWDIEVVSNKITIREAQNKIHLQLIANPPKEISVTKVNMSIRGAIVEGDSEKFRILDLIADSDLQMSGVIMDNNPIGFNYN